MQYFIHTYGCQMNVHESEKLAGILSAQGFTEAKQVEEANVIIFNTCCIRDTAETKIMGNIGAVKQLKRANKGLKIVVCGCMTQQDGRARELVAKFPFIDVVMGTHNLDKLSDYLALSAKGKRVIAVEDAAAIVEDAPLLRTSYPNAWVNITFGCNNFCTYCIVPYVRGRERSRTARSVLTEVKGLVEQGYKEITLLGQNVNSYGNDLKDGTNFATLLQEIDKIEGKFRVRFMTSHPKDFNREIIDIIASGRHICHNVHLPVQAGSDRILQLMNRHYDRAHYLDIINSIKEKLPDCGITTDIMVGFPGETEEDFADTMRLVSQVGYSNAFTFVYSMRKGTPAAEMEQVPRDIKKDRITRLIALQNSITKTLSEGYLGRVYEVLCEDVNPKLKGYVCGRTDCGRLVNFRGSADLIGQFVNVKIEQAKSASLFGSITEQ